MPVGAHKPPAHGTRLSQRHLDTDVSHNLRWPFSLVSLGFGSTVEGALRAAFLLSESVHLIILGSGMCRRRVEENEISLKFLCFKELGDL